MQKITPNLWFDRQAEEAAKLYVSIFPNSSIGTVSRFGKEGSEIHKMPEGTAMTVNFNLNGHDFVGLNGGPMFKFTEAISFIIDCKDQEEVDHYWYKLTADGGQESNCGWLKDKFGVSWQVIPRRLYELFSDSDKAKAGRTMNAMLKMKKLDIAELEKAAEG
jgi:predicted 3-demethylubiquinone-9 3-methyltransferase (glyoxalase superfamily)